MYSGYALLLLYVLWQAVEFSQMITKKNYNYYNFKRILLYPFIIVECYY